MLYCLISLLREASFFFFNPSQGGGGILGLKWFKCEFDFFVVFFPRERRPLLSNKKKRYAYIHLGDCITRLIILKREGRGRRGSNDADIIFFLFSLSRRNGGVFGAVLYIVWWCTFFPPPICQRDSEKFTRIVPFTFVRNISFPLLRARINLNKLRDQVNSFITFFLPPHDVCSFFLKNLSAAKSRTNMTFDENKRVSSFLKEQVKA